MKIFNKNKKRNRLEKEESIGESNKLSSSSSNDQNSVKIRVFRIN
jgi:hypothetical protein